jgi:NDP-sugar pyrophosphorylase family protein
VHGQARLAGPFYVGPGCEVEAGAQLGPDAALVADVRVRAGACVRDSVLWRAVEVGPEGQVQGCLLGPGVQTGRSAVLRGAVLGEGTVVSDYSRTL